MSCVCGKVHTSYCLEEPCYFTAAWPHPYADTQSMEDLPWLTLEQRRRQEVYKLQREAANG